MYLNTMEEVCADTQKIEMFVSLLSEQESLEDSLNKISIDKRFEDFVKFSFSIITSKNPHLIASIFTFGREDLIPTMFIEILNTIDADNIRYSKLKYYLERHIELDGDEHGPLSLQMVSELCENDSKKWNEAYTVAKFALDYRIALWDVIYDKILLCMQNRNSK